MPVLLIRTNVKRDQMPPNMASELTDLMAETLNRPKAGTCIIVQDNQYMAFGGTTDPCASCVIQDFEHFSEVENKRISAVIMGYLYKALNVDKRRMYLEFAGVTKEDIGFAASTFHQFFGPTCNGVDKHSAPEKTFIWPEGS